MTTTSLMLYMTTVTANREIDKKQKKIKMILDSKGIAYQEVDMFTEKEKKDEMRERLGVPDALPPQLFNGEQYCGDYEAFEDAIEDGNLMEFLLLK